MVPAITFGGMASGLPPNIVDQLIEAEKIPLKNLETKKSKIETRLSLVNDLDSKLSNIRKSIGTLASKRGFNDIKVISGDPNIIQGTVDPSAGIPGSWKVEVLELAQKAAAVTNGYPDKDRTEIGVGYFQFETSNGEKEVYINGNNNTLEGVAAAINAADVGVRAAVINDRSDTEYPYRLMISGKSVGGDSKVIYPTLYFLDGDMDLYFENQKEAKSGVIKIDGIDFSIDDNTITDVIPGVTLELRQTSPGRHINVTVKEDNELIFGKVDEFIKSMNEVFSFIQTQNNMDANTDTSTTLGGDSLLRRVENRLRRLIQSSQIGVRGPIKRLNHLGIAFNRNGTLDFDREKFNSILSKNPEGVQKFFAGDGFNVGFIPSLKNNLSVLTNSNFGSLALRKKSLQDNISRIDTNIENKERMLVKKESSLRQKFAKLEETMSRLKSQGSQLTAIGAGGSNIKLGPG